MATCPDRPKATAGAWLTVHLARKAEPSFCAVAIGVRRQVVVILARTILSPYRAGIPHFWSLAWQRVLGMGPVR
jgi:hypothetical protein